MIFLLVLLLFLYLLPIKNKKIKYGLIVVPFLVLALIRYGFGADYFSYGFIYETLSMDSLFHVIAWQMKYEPLFKLLLAVFKFFGAPYQLILSLISAILFTLMSLWIYRNSKNYVLSIVLYISMFYFVWSLSALRQGIAVVLGLFLLFDKKQYTLKTQIISIVILSLFHYSALFLFVIMIFNRYELTKKQILIMVGISLIFSILPLGDIIEVMPFIPFRTKILQYIEPGLSFLKFGYLVRLGFATLFIVFYDKLRLINKKMLDNLLFGFSIYFLFSFSPIMAGRLSIYTYILIVAFIPKIILTIESKRIASGLLIVFITLYYGKEVIALVDQSGMNGFIKIPTIFDKNSYSFDTYYYYLVNSDNKLEERYNEFRLNVDRMIDSEPVGYNPNLYNFPGYVDRDYGYIVYDSNGDYSIYYRMRGTPSIYKDVLVNYYDVGSLFKEKRYMDISETGRSVEELVLSVSNYMLENMKLENLNEEKIDINFSEMHNSVKQLFEFPQNIKNFDVYKITDPFEYYIIEATYYYDRIFVVLDSDKELLFPYMLKTFDPFDISETAIGTHGSYKFHFNKNGKIIWMEN